MHFLLNPTQPQPHLTFNVFSNDLHLWTDTWTVPSVTVRDPRTKQSCAPGLFPYLGFPIHARSEGKCLFICAPAANYGH